ncbi:SdpI family protein [Rhodocaloribacter litoris]|uniref:SdpI family protein n=1 Tax=Rhodocaloribacter litoris TaxID=2558931 RepID=UPI00141E3CE8|nr:SdpI family protein [Rhodocaloribacter litoris]QXD14526.1 SdpI family protein [Rhodocaloribacter litoris]
MNPGIFLGLTNVLCALLGIGLSLPLLRGRVKPNRLYGVRFRKAFESEALWYDINRYGARRMIFWSTVLLLIGLAAFFVPLEEEASLPVWLFALAPLLYLVPCLETYRYARGL